MENIINPLLGGIIIGLATTLMLGLLGRICGISGILGGTLGKFKGEHLWRYVFILGLVAGGGLMLYMAPNYFSYTFKFSYMEAIVAGLLVGFGTRLGGGCTSGHGVCGLPRLSARSLIATVTFIGVAVVTVLVRSFL